MDVCGEGAAVGRDHLLRLAREGGVGLPMAEATLDRMVELAAAYTERAEAFPIRRATVRRMSSAIAASRGRIQGIRRGN